MQKQLADYLMSLLPADKSWIHELKEQATLEHVPIMDSLSIHFFLQLIKMHKPKRILEIGTAIGYSALRMVDAYPNTMVTTIEKDSLRYQQAIENIQKYDKADQIHVIFGDALEQIPQIALENPTFDCVFIDAAKGQYQRFFELTKPLLASNGFIVTDNILFRGYVANPELVGKRHKKMVEKIRKYNTWVAELPDFDTAFIPIGDGVAVSYKK